MLEFIMYFLKIILYTVGGLIACGIITWLINDSYRYLIVNSFGKDVYFLTSYIGTPVHELGHAIMCLIFGHKIVEMRFHTLNDKNRYGYVYHKFNPKNPYHQVGNFFIGLGPIFSGFFVILLIVFLIFREPTIQFFNSCIELINSGAGITDIFMNNINFLKTAILSDTHIALKILAFVLILPISLHIYLSFADIVSSVKGFGYYFIIALIFAIATFFMGGSVVAGITSGLSYFFVITCAIYSFIIAFSLINLTFGLTVFCLTKFFSKS